MGIEVDSVQLPHGGPGQLTGMHIRLHPLMSSTMVEVVGYRGFSLGLPRLEVRATIPYNPLALPSLSQVIWTIGDEIRALGAVLNEEE